MSLLKFGSDKWREWSFLLSQKRKLTKFRVHRNSYKKAIITAFVYLDSQCTSFVTSNAKYILAFSLGVLKKYISIVIKVALGTIESERDKLSLPENRVKFHFLCLCLNVFCNELWSRNLQVGTFVYMYIYRSRDNADNITAILKN